MPRIATLIIAAATCVFACGQANAQAIILEPTDNWVLQRSGEYCGLSRNFGSLASPVILNLYSYGPSGNFRITVASEGLPRNSNKAQVGNAGFGGLEAMQDVHAIVGQGGDAGSISFFANRGYSGFRFGYAWSAERDVAMEIPFDPQSTQLTFDTGEMEPRTLMVGSLENALQDLAGCEAALLESWHFNPATEQSIATPAVFENGWDVVRAIRRPDAMLVNRSSQMVQIRLLIDAEGNAEDCVLQSPNWRDRDARGVCNAFTRLGEYAPARNAAGEPVPSLLRGSYLMLVYD